MLGKSKRGLGVRKSVFARTSALIGAAAAAALLPSAALAQEQQDQTQTQTEGEEEIVVTGTRVVRPDYAYSNPVTSVSGEALEYSGVVNVTDFLQELPALTNSFDSNDASGANAFIGGTGLNLLNLRNLGVDRTLVLVNGRRHVASLPGSAAVDTATIPLELIERIDVSTGGASAVYGADGVSGVVNFILRDDYEGFGVRAQSGWTEEGGAEEQFISGIWGFNSDGGRANLTLAAEYAHEGRLTTNDREFTRGANWTDFFENPADIIDGDDDPDIVDFVPVNNVRIGILSPASAIFTDLDDLFALFGDPSATLLPNFEGNGTAWVPGVSIDSGGTFFQGGSGLLVPDLFTDILPDVDRYALNAMFHYDLSSTMRLFTELKYVNTQSFSLGQATFDQFLAVDLDNPFLPADAATAAGAAGLPFALVSRYNNDFGQRGEDITRETYRAVIGLNGDLAPNIQYEMSIVYGATTTDQLNVGNRWNDRFAAAIDVVDIDPGPGQDLRCRIDVMPIVEAGGFGGGTDWNRNVLGYPAPGSFTPGPGSGCVPLDIFGEGEASQAALDWISLTTQNSSTITQTVAQAYLTGNLDSWFRLPGGSVGFAAGAEWREETSSSRFDVRDNSGLTFFNVIPNSDGSFNVGEAFAEISLPIFEDRPLFDSLALDAAVRFSDYSTVGQTMSWKVGLVWAPIRDITFRSTIAEAVRAPNIGELFDPGGQTFAFITDPCDAGNVNNGSATREANCATELNGLGIDPTTFSDPNASGVEGILTGNDTLQEETAETFTFGVILRPRFIENLVLSADYYDIDLSDAINTPTGQEIIDQCYDAPDLNNRFCDLLTRRSTDGGIDFFVQRPENVAAFTTRGIDFSAAYTIDTGQMGRLGFRLVGNHLEELTFVNLAGADPDIDRYEQGAPEWQANFDVLWEIGAFKLNYGVNYFSETQRFNLATRQGDPDIAAPEWLDFSARFTQDIQVRYDFTGAFTFYGGVNNLTAQEPDYGQTYYPVGAEGRTFYVGLNARLN